MSEEIPERLGEFRSYLRVLAGMQLDPQIKARVDPSDIVQQTLLQAHRAAAQFRGNTDAELAGWLRQILANELAHQLRDNRRAKRDVAREVSYQQSVEQSSLRLERLLVSTSPSPSENVQKKERAIRLAELLTLLPDQQRESIELHYWHGWTLQKIADQQKRSKSAVAGSIGRGLKQLQSDMEQAS